MKKHFARLRAFSLRHSKTAAALVLPAVAMSVGSAHAAAGDIDVTGVVTAITAVAATVALIGAPKLIMRVGVKIWGWISSVI